MRKIIGNNVCVFLKSSSSSTGEPDIYGLLIDVTEESIYIQGEIHDPRMYVVPKENINYCTTDCIPSYARMISSPKQEEPHAPQLIRQESKELSISVYVDKELIIKIPVPPTFKLEQWHDGIMRAIMGNPDVNVALCGKVQSAIEYFPGEVYISTVTEEAEAEQNEGQSESESPQTEFVMVGGNPMSEYMNPSQMVTRLQNVASRRGKKNGN